MASGESRLVRRRDIVVESQTDMHADTRHVRNPAAAVQWTWFKFGSARAVIAT